MKKLNTAVQGWLAVNKPEGITSAGVVRKIKAHFPRSKIGHAGTLDPFASGVLLLAFGEATKLISYAMDKPKSYDFIVRWGEERDTDDVEGVITQTSAHIPIAADIEQTIPQFCGKILQTPPLYSAIKIQGRRACDRVRKGEEVVLKPREVFVSQLAYQGPLGKERGKFTMTCQKGVYVRSIARDLGRALHTFAYVEKLHRTSCGGFVEKKAIDLHKLLESIGETEISNIITRFDIVLDDIPAILLTQENMQRLRYGQSISTSSLDIPGTSLVACKGEKGLVEALAEYSNGHLIPKRVFNISN